MSAATRNNRTIFTAVLVFVATRSTWSFPLLKPAVIMLPTQNFMQQPIKSSVVRPLRMAAMNQFSNTHYASPSPESMSNEEQLQHNNGHQNPQNAYENNNMNPHNVYENNNMNPPGFHENNIDIQIHGATDPQHDYENNMHQQNIYENNNMNPPSFYENDMNTHKQASTNPQHDYESNMHQQNIYGNNNMHPQNIYENNINQAGTKQDYDSIVIEVGNQPFPGYMQPIEEFPDGKFAIGSIIMGIPWLPFEVNVPDTIAWMYNGIAGIIGGIGQRIPFINRFTSPNEPRPYSAINQMFPGRPFMMPLRILQIPMPIMNMQQAVLGR